MFQFMTNMCFNMFQSIFLFLVHGQYVFSMMLSHIACELPSNTGVVYMNLPSTMINHRFICDDGGDLGQVDE